MRKSACKSKLFLGPNSTSRPVSLDLQRRSALGHGKQSSEFSARCIAADPTAMYA